VRELNFTKIVSLAPEVFAILVDEIKESGSRLCFTYMHAFQSKRKRIVDDLSIRRRHLE